MPLFNDRRNTNPATDITVSSWNTDSKEQKQALAEARALSARKAEVARLKAAAKVQGKATKINKNMAKSELKSAVKKSVSGVQGPSTAPQFGDGQTRYNPNQPFNDHSSLNLLKAKSRAGSAGISPKKINKIVGSAGRGSVGLASGGAMNINDLR